MEKIARAIGLLGLIASGILFQPAPSTAAVLQPKVGDCLNYQETEVFLASAKGKQVKCSGLHNTEIYRVSKFKSGQNLPSLDPLALSQIAQTVCSTWRGTSNFFNQWTFRVPTNSEWKTGARWIRCEALKTEEIPEDDGSLRVVSFRGKKLDFK